MSELSIQEMLDAGAHFGHQTRRWNPKMRPFIYGARSGVHILDLQQTFDLARKAIKAVEDVVANGETVLFVGTKSQAQPIIEEQAKRCNMPYVTRRWLGGMLTNFNTVNQSVQRLLDLESRREKNELQGYTKKERLEIDREIERLESTLGGIKTLRSTPGAIFVVDPSNEKIAVHEANVLGIPVIAITDSNCDPDPIDYIIPANDDAMGSILYFASRVADACNTGLQKQEEFARADNDKGSSPRKGRKAKADAKAYVTKADTFDPTEAVESFSAVAAPANGTEGV